MPKSILPLLLCVALAAGAVALFKMRAAAKDDDGPSRFEAVKRKVTPKLEKALGEMGLRLGSPEIGRASCRERVSIACRSRWSPYH